MDPKIQKNVKFKHGNIIYDFYKLLLIQVNA